MKYHLTRISESPEAGENQARDRALKPGLILGRDTTLTLRALLIFATNMKEQRLPVCQIVCLKEKNPSPSTKED